MEMIIVAVASFAISFAIGYIFGYAIKLAKTRNKLRKQEEIQYGKVYRDGTYFG